MQVLDVDLAAAVAQRLGKESHKCASAVLPAGSLAYCELLYLFGRDHSILHFGHFALANAKSAPVVLRWLVSTGLSMSR